ncbi:solid-state culture specific protein [Aspergillus sclerotioniger CBS 115572]|uniref:Solid-state culture specific protein n=1 Tax=Aspergillus sclerotioniger CBS 115572 TaxID=1450535 RepID=A0A317UYJ4_9EURO|nr:solid-state culture specific protein [Aspergillus sclerotioniger CBS 115572]PWY67134.1 solid-state culture specific protein [Aspergillus sclerotioniger CBS 115572]
MTALTRLQPLPVASPRPYALSKPVTRPLPITLDYTLHDLYVLDNDDGPHNIILAYDHPCKFPRDQISTSSTVQFLYAGNFPGADAEEEFPNISKRGVAQRYSFVAGRASVIMVDLSGSGGDDLAAIVHTSKEDILAVYNQLCPDQRPNVQFIRNVHDIQLDPDSRAAVVIPQDHLCHFNQLLDPKVHYEILSKRWLALCGLPTPKSRVIDPLPMETRAGRDVEIKRMLHAVQIQALPFVVKVSIATSGRGTYVVYSESERRSTSNELRSLLEDILDKVHEQNEGLYPASFVIQELVPGEAHGVTFFVTKKGRVVYLATCQQRFDEDGYWHGAHVSYLLEPAFQHRYRNTLEILAKELHKKGYYGPAGADIMTDKNGKQVIVDVNPRVTGSYQLGLLKTHFMQRGLFEAAVLTPLTMRCTRGTFEGQFAREIMEGRMIINSWVHDSKREFSYAAVTVGGEDTVQLGRLVRIMETFVNTGEYSVGAGL